MTTSAKLMTADEMFDMPDDGRRYELIQGELIELTPPPGSQHGFVAAKVGARLAGFVEPRELGSVFAAETGFLISTEPDTVRAPDAAFVCANRIPKDGLPPGYLQLAPDIVVEVVSPSDRATDVQDKVRAWLDAGSRLVWVAYPSTKSVMAYRVNGQVTVVQGDQVLDGDPVLDEFSIPVSELFE